MKLWPSRDGDRGPHPYLVAYYQTECLREDENDAFTSSNGDDRRHDVITDLELQSWAAENLPQYMVPRFLFRCRIGR